MTDRESKQETLRGRRKEESSGCEGYKVLHLKAFFLLLDSLNVMTEWDLWCRLDVKIWENFVHDNGGVRHKPVMIWFLLSALFTVWDCVCGAFNKSFSLCGSSIKESCCKKTFCKIFLVFCHDSSETLGMRCLSVGCSACRTARQKCLCNYYMDCHESLYKHL